MKNSAHWEITDEVYNATLSLYVGKRNYYTSSAQSLFKIDLGESTAAGEYQQIVKDGHTFHLVWIRSWRKRGCIADRCTLAHEILHAVFGILRERGIRPSSSSEEAYTYYFDNLYGKALRRLHSFYGY